MQHITTEEKENAPSVFAMIALAASAAGAQEQPQCAPRDSLAASLTEKYGERPMGIGLRDASSVIETWANPRTGTWTILLTRTDGVACVITTGTAWINARLRAPTPQGEPS